MWRCAGLFRTREGLQEAVGRLDLSYESSTKASLLRDANEWRFFNLLTTARLIARAALRREESRGGHFREDFPQRDDLHWRVHLAETSVTTNNDQ
jgi:L-aspartate oxidase